MNIQDTLLIDVYSSYFLHFVKHQRHVLSSSNGSPVCSNDIETEEGDLLATISKKRKGIKMVPNFDARINVGEGRFVTLSDASTYQHLDKTMKDNAIEQVSELQEQMALLIEKLKSH